MGSRRRRGSVRSGGASPASAGGPRALRVARVFALLAFLDAAVGPAPARAYLDPGSGSFVIQVLLASVFSALFFFRRIWAAVRRGVRRLFGRGEADGG